VLLGWLPPRAVATLLTLDVLATNPFLALFFRWGHEAVVFGQADKTLFLCALHWLFVCA
jgi:hypothetical protein